MKKLINIGISIATLSFSNILIAQVNNDTNKTIICNNLKPGQEKNGYLVVTDGDGEYGIKNPSLLESVVNSSLKVCTSHVTNMRWIFYRKTFSKNVDINNWDVSNVTDMSRMFAGSKFNSNISNWNVSNVKDMQLMFAQSSFNGDISNWNVSKVTNMSQMFALARFNQDISKWSVQNVKNMSWMFMGSKFNQNISKWDVSSVTNMTNMFSGSKFNQNISNWKTNPKVAHKEFAVESPLSNNTSYSPNFNL